ncbi:MAG: hypothetical protein IPH37_18055 [Burkholderiales bacterium]|nr:hypothetical protein [Burkholderiales bacterium]
MRKKPMQGWLDWLTSVDFQDNQAACPDWVRSAIAFGKIPGDASYWMLPIGRPVCRTGAASNED